MLRSKRNLFPCHHVHECAAEERTVNPMEKAFPPQNWNARVAQELEEDPEFKELKTLLKTLLKLI